MEDSPYQCQQQIIYKAVKRQCECLLPLSNSRSQSVDAININFDCKTEIFVPEEERSFQSIYSERITGYKIIINNRSAWPAETIYSQIKEALYHSCCNIQHNLCEALAMGILCQAKNIVNRISSQSVEYYNVLNIDVFVLVRHKHTENHNLMLDHQISCLDMVPASDSSIGLLEKMILIDFDDENCSICLEEFTDGDEATSLPCAHLFHGSCIQKWLHTSHYCPMCRFEMPIARF